MNSTLNVAWCDQPPDNRLVGFCTTWDCVEFFPSRGVIVECVVFANSVSVAGNGPHSQACRFHVAFGELERRNGACGKERHDLLTEHMLICC